MIPPWFPQVALIFLRKVRAAALAQVLLGPCQETRLDHHRAQRPGQHQAYPLALCQALPLALHRDFLNDHIQDMRDLV
jgi:hypothetical protein